MLRAGCQPLGFLPSRDRVRLPASAGPWLPGRGEWGARSCRPACEGASACSPRLPLSLMLLGCLSPVSVAWTEGVRIWWHLRQCQAVWAVAPCSGPRTNLEGGAGAPRGPPSAWGTPAASPDNPAAGLGRPPAWTNSPSLFHVISHVLTESPRNDPILPLKWRWGARGSQPREAQATLTPSSPGFPPHAYATGPRWARARRLTYKTRTSQTFGRLGTQGSLEIFLPSCLSMERGCPKVTETHRSPRGSWIQRLRQPLALPRSAPFLLAGVSI